MQHAWERWDTPTKFWPRDFHKFVLFSFLFIWKICSYFSLKIRSRGSSVSIVTRLQAKTAGFVFRQELGFLFATSSRPTLGSTQPPMQWVSAAISPEVKRPGREADHSFPSGAKIKNVSSYTFTPPIRGT
jgi:hypothetical protein